MVPEDPFEPEMGKIRAQAPKSLKSFRSQVLHATARSGGMAKPGSAASRSVRFVSKRGRGGGVARVVSGSSGRTARTRRVVVKARYVKLTGKGLSAAAAHLKYIQRDGVTREGERGQLYGPETGRVDGGAFMDRSAGDKTQFRFILSPEDAQQYDDLKPLTRKLMRQMEDDLGSKLDWVAVDHYNTGHPHTHIVIRGRDDQGQDLVIAREYISEGFRARAEAQVSLDLGPRSDLEISARLQEEVGKSSLTSIDRALLRDAGDGGLVAAGHRDPEYSALRTGRLVRLRDFGLAEDLGQGQWRLRGDMEPTLRALGERGDIIKALHHELKAIRMEQAAPDAVIHDGQTPATGQERPVTGRVLKRGLADELTDRHYLMVEATDGRVHYIDIGRGDRVEALGKQAIVRVTATIPELRPSDHNIVAVAARNGGYYSVDAHLKLEPAARQAFAETHMRRLEAIRKSTQGIGREADGRFRIGPDYLDKAMAFEEKEARRSPVKIDVVSDISLEAQTRRNGVTYLDREWIAGSSERHASQGFGGEVRGALQRRQQWLVEEGLAGVNTHGEVVPTDKMIETLHRRELVAAGAALSKETGLAFKPVRDGELVEGRLRQSVTLGSGKFAVVERARDFSLVPWKPVLEKHIGKEVSGVMRESGINWSIGRDKGPGIGM